MPTLRGFSNRHIGSQVTNIKKGDWIYLENSLSKKRWSLYFKYNNIDETALDLTYITEEQFFKLRGTDMKFSNIVINPPYQAEQNAEGKRGGGSLLWPKIVMKCRELLEPNGFFTAITPSLWRKPTSDNSTTLEVTEWYNTMQLHHLNINNTNDGMRVFGAGTRFDICVFENVAPYTDTEIIDELNNTHHIDVTKLPFIPNFGFDMLRNLLKTEEDGCEILFSNSAYETRKEHVSSQQTEEFKYPLVHSTPKSGTRYMYSSRSDRGHYGVPKIIFGEGGIGEVIIDMEGRYGMTQQAMAIKVSSLEEAEGIKNVLLSEKFNIFLKSVSYSIFRIDWRMFTYFKKDFWKEFI
jgi:hypothetical protein